MYQDKIKPHMEFKLKDLVLTTFNLFFAGTETVSSTLCYGLLLMMKHPGVEAKIDPLLKWDSTQTGVYARKGMCKFHERISRMMNPKSME